MMTTLLSCALSGLDPTLVQVEVDLSNGLPGCQIVGLPDSIVQEARDRIRAAIRNSGFDFPMRRITINLAPADQKKEGSGFDLAMALGILATSGQLLTGAYENFLLVGELGLNGSLRPVPGLLAMAEICQNGGPRQLIAPVQNAKEAAILPGVQVWPASSLLEVIQILQGEKEPLKEKIDWFPADDLSPDLCHVKGQEQAKRALEIAAAGNHNILFIGPPGSGKTMLAERITGLLPEPTFHEAIQIAKIRSVAGLFRASEGLARNRPFRAPHSTTSYAGIVGGGNPIRPGELSLAHHGVLFMDEFPQFHRNVLESLRQPLEEKKVTIARMSGFVTYPADFLLVAAMNPCPCGYYGDLQRECLCRPSERLQYRKRISGPLVDRIDLQIEVSRIPPEKLIAFDFSEKSFDVRGRAARAREIQNSRYGARTPNSRVSQEILAEHLYLSREAGELLKEAYAKLHFSARGHSKILRVARTIADLDGSAGIQGMHLAEALQYRILDRNFYF